MKCSSDNHRDLTDGWEELAREHYKAAVAAKLGLKEKIDSHGWESLTAAECGRIGGKLGGKLGKNLWRKIAEAALSELDEGRGKSPEQPGSPTDSGTKHPRC